MKSIPLAILVFVFSSCNVLKISKDRNTGNTKEIGIAVTFDAKATNQYTKDVETSVANVIQKFNNEHHSFSVHKKTAADKAYLTLNFSKLKIVSNGGATIGYVVSALGLIATPLAVYQLSDQTVLLAFWYFPANRFIYQGSLSPSLEGGKGVPQPFIVESGALFRNKEKRLEATKTNFEKQLYKTLLKLEKQIQSH